MNFAIYGVHLSFQFYGLLKVCITYCIIFFILYALVLDLMDVLQFNLQVKYFEQKRIADLYKKKLESL